MTWAEFYAEPLKYERQMEKIGARKKLLTTVIQHSSESVLEIGIGTGGLSIYLSRHVDKVVGIDNDPEVVEYARRNNDFLSGDAEFKQVDATDFNGSFDVAFSQGLLEHFTDPEKINNILKAHTRNSDVAFITVPSRFYALKDYGDENLLTKEEWLSIFDDGFEVEACYFGMRIPHVQRVLENQLLKIFQVLKGYPRGERPYIMFKVMDK